MFKWIVALLTILAHSVSCHQIMFLPLSERTHMLVHLKLATELARRNHTIYFIAADCLSSFALQTAEQMAPGVQLQYIQYSLDCSYHEQEKRAARQLSRLGEVMAIYGNVVGRVDDMLSDTALMQQLAELAPSTDLLVGDIFSFGMLLAAKLQLSHIDLDVGTAGSLWEPAVFGAEPGTSFVPALGTFLPTNGMSFWQRVANFAAAKVSQAAVQAAFWHPRSKLQRVVAKHAIPLARPYTGPMLLLVNSNFALEPPRAVAPNTQYIGPILPEEPQHLQPAALEQFVSAAGPLGVVLVSFGGTLQPSLAASRALASIIQSLPQVSFVWKLSEADQQALHATGTDLSSIHNAYISTWLPQNDLLGHPNVRAFITQGGYLSMGEAAYHGVPVLGMPYIPGQGELIRTAEDQGRAMRLAGDALERGHTRLVRDAILDLLSKASYTAAAQLVRERLTAARRPYKDVAADWVEHAAALKGHKPFLHPQKLHQAWWQEAMLDVLALYAAVASALLMLLWRWLWWYSWTMQAVLHGMWRATQSGGSKVTSRNGDAVGVGGPTCAVTAHVSLPLPASSGCDAAKTQGKKCA